MLHYHTGTTVPDEEMISNEQKQRERSLSPDSLEQRLFKQQILLEDDDDEESFLSSSDSISIDPQQRQSNSTRTLLKTFTSHGLLSTLTLFNDDDDDNNNNNDDIEDDDLDDIHIDQDDVNLLFSDPDDGILCRLSSDLIDVDDDYDDNDDFCQHIRPLPIVTSSDLIIPSLISLHDQDQHQLYSPYHFLDPISEAASEEERRAAISIIRQQQKHKHSTSSSLSISANGHCDGDTTANDDFSTLSDIDEQNASMDENSAFQTSPRCHDQQQQHVHKKRRHTEIRSLHWSTKNGSKLISID
jgi:hypothetical protein